MTTEITAASTTVVSGSESASLTTSQSDSAVISTDFETFIQLLTAQAQYQDPLEPIDSTEYAAQLSQFSMVEQQVLTNENLDTLLTQIGLQNAAALATWVGMDVRSVAPGYFDGQSLTVTPVADAAATYAELVAYDVNGAEVNRRPVELDGAPVEWTGVDDDGNVLPVGHYTFFVESYRQDELIAATQAPVYGRVTEAQIFGDAVTLVLEGGQSIQSVSVSALREPLDASG